MNKEKIALLVDSGTDVPEALVKQYGMYVLPLQIIYPEKTYTDKVDITPEEVYQRLEKEIPSTSLPDGATIQAIFDKIKEAGYEKVLAVTISSGLSGTYNVVRLLGEQTEGLDVFVLDTKNIGIGAGIQAIRAAELIETGLGWQELQQKLTEEVANAKVFFNVATLEYLQKGGRIAHGAAEEEAKAMMERLKAAFPQAEEIYFGTISPALVVHTGPGLLGVGIQLLND